MTSIAVSSSTDDGSVGVVLSVLSGVYVVDVVRGGFVRVDVRWGEFVPFRSLPGRLLFELYLSFVFARVLADL